MKNDGIQTRRVPARCRKVARGLAGLLHAAGRRRGSSPSPCTLQDVGEGVRQAPARCRTSASLPLLCPVCVSLLPVAAPFQPVYPETPGAGNLLYGDRFRPVHALFAHNARSGSGRRRTDCLHRQTLVRQALSGSHPRAGTGRCGGRFATFRLHHVRGNGFGPQLGICRKHTHVRRFRRDIASNSLSGRSRFLPRQASLPV